MRPDETQLTGALAEFKRLFETKVSDPTWHPSEEGVRECLARGLREGLELAVDDLAYERLLRQQRIDLWIDKFGLAVELKFHRPIQSGHGRPMTQQFGALLADCRKLASADASDRLFVLVTDVTGYTHLTNKGILPVSARGPKVITERDIDGLPSTAARSALYGGPWLTLSAELVWHPREPTWTFFAWRIVPAIVDDG